MDPVTIEKLRAMKHYRKSNSLQTLVQYYGSAFVLGVCFFMGFSSICSSINLFSVSLSNLRAFFFGPKCLFLLCNLIVIYLVTESKLMGSSPPSALPDSNVYSEYVKHSQGFRRFSSAVGGKEEEKKLEVIKEAVVEDIEEVERGGGEVKRKKGDYGLDGEEEEEPGLPTDELNKRVEAFIARVSKQRRLEAEMMNGG